MQQTIGFKNKVHKRPEGGGVATIQKLPTPLIKTNTISEDEEYLQTTGRYLRTITALQNTQSLLDEKTWLMKLARGKGQPLMSPDEYDRFVAIVDGAITARKQKNLDDYIKTGA